MPRKVDNPYWITFARDIVGSDYQGKEQRIRVTADQEKNRINLSSMETGDCVSIDAEIIPVVMEVLQTFYNETEA